MNKLQLWSSCYFVLLGLAFCPAVSAGTSPGIEAEFSTAFIGQPFVDVEFIYTTGGSGATGLAFDVTYEAALFTATNCAGVFVVCDIETPGRISYQFDSTSPIPTGTIVTIRFAVDVPVRVISLVQFDPSNPAGPPAGPVFTDAVTSMQMALPFVNGAIAICCDGLFLIPHPAAGSDIALNIESAQRGSTGTNSIVFRDASGFDNNAFNVTCSLSDSGDGAFAIVGATTIVVPAGDSNSIVVSGRSSLTDPQPTGQMDCTYNDGLLGALTVPLGIGLAPLAVPGNGPWSLAILTMILMGFGIWQLAYSRNGTLPAR